MCRRSAGWLCALGAVLLAVTVPTAHAASAGVSIQNFEFYPSSVTINPGESVTWTQKDVGTQHTVTGSGFDSGALSTNGTYTHMFNEPGTYSYHCSIHQSMQGTVTVKGSAPPSPQAPAPTAPPSPAPAPAPVAAPTTAAPRATTSVPTTTTIAATTTVAPTTTVPPTADQSVSPSTTVAAASLALPAQTVSSGDDLNPALVVLAILLAACAAGGTLFVRRRVGQPSG